MRRGPLQPNSKNSSPQHSPQARPFWRRALAVSAVTAVASALLVAQPAAAAPFTGLEATVYLAQDVPTQLKSSVQNDGELVFSDVGNVSTRTYNAIGYNEQDNFLYGISNAELIRIHSNGGIVKVRDVPITAHVGAFRGETQDFWFTNGNRVFHTNVANPTGAMLEVPLSQPMPAADFTWADGYFWGMTGTQIVRMSTTGVVNLFAAPAGSPGSPAGGAWTYGNGNIGFTANATGAITQIKVNNPASATPTFTVVSVISGPPSGNNDATASLGSPADLALTKTFDNERVLAGGDGSFDLTVTNNGAGISSGYTVSDAVPAGLTALVLPTGCSVVGSALTCSGGRLDVGASATFQIGATVNAALSSGSLVNTASVLGNEADQNAANNTSSDTLVVERAALTIVKTAELDDANGNAIPDVGETIDYRFVVHNTGSIPTTEVTVNDARVSGITPASVNLAAGASETFQASYTITQEDIDLGTIANTATAEGSHEFGTVESPPSTATLDAPPEPELQAVKSATLNDTNGNGAADAGETIAYEVAVTNIGNVTVADVTVADPLVTLSPATADLAPTQSATFTGEYTVTPADVSAGSVVNTAVASGTTPGGDPIESPPTSTTTETASPSLTIVKSAEFNDTNGNDLLDAGETIVYSFVVTNDGNVAVNNVTIDDNLVTGITPTSADLAPGGQVIFTAAPYIVTDVDVTAGSVENTASATGTPPGGEPITTVPSTVTVPTVDPVADWELAKQSRLNDTNGNGRADVGETIDYSFLATNTGTLTISDVTVSDEKVSGITPASATLIPGERITFTADPYTVTQADVDAGTVFNEATGTAMTPGGEELVPPPSENNVPTPDAAPSLRTVKTAALSDDNENGVADLGEQITYTITVTNTGNVTLSDVSVSDPKAGALTPASVASLAPRASAVFTSAAYTVTVEDIDSGSVDNTATATATPPDGPPVTRDGSTTTETVDPSLEVVKTAELEDANGNDVADPGETITYLFTVKNTGNTQLEDVTIDDPRVDSVSPASATVDVGSTQLFTAEYTVTEEDILSGDDISNTATATGTVPGAGEITTPPSTALVPPVPVEAGLTLTKSSVLNDDNDNGVADLGETIDYSFIAENTGNVTLTDVSVDDDRVTGLTPATATIAPGSTAVFSADPYTVTQADVDAGEVVNEAVASATTPNGDEVPSDPTTNIVPGPDPVGALVAEKSAALDDANDNGVADEGEQIVYTIILTNTGNVTLSDVSADDPMVTGLTPTSVGSLAPGMSATFTADPYVVTSADVANGVVLNEATGSGTTPGELPVDSPPTTVSTPTFDPGMLVEKSAELDDANDNGMADLGETVQYTFVVVNTGNVSIEDVVIDDPKATGITPASATVGVGETVTFTAEPYAVSEADIIAGELENTATATGTPDGGEPITTPPSVVTVPPAPMAAELSVDKTAHIVDANDNGIADLGESIEYTITVTNTGNVTVFDVTISDPKLTGLTPSSVDAIAPGESVTATADPYEVTSTDAARGSVTNVATASGTDPHGDLVDAASPEVTTPTGALAATGSPVPVALVAFAALLLIAGAATVVITRRIRTSKI